MKLRRARSVASYVKWTRAVKSLTREIAELSPNLDRDMAAIHKMSNAEIFAELAN
jgi:hypothetical protein